MSSRLAVLTLPFALLVACEEPLPGGVTRRGGEDVGPAPVDGGRAGGDRDAAVSPDPPGSVTRDAGTPPPPGDGDGVDPIDAGVALTPEEQDLLDAVNAERASGGLAPVAVDERLLCAARRHALDVGGSGACGHVGSDGSWPWDRAMACGFPQHDWTVNEIAAGPGFTDGADAVWGWRHSSGHYAALMHPRATVVGVGVHATCFIALFDCCVAGSE